MTEIFDRLTEQEKREVRMFGCTTAQMTSAVQASLQGRYATPALMAASILSDAQELLVADEQGRCEVEDARQAINRAKWILFEYYDRAAQI